MSLFPFGNTQLEVSYDASEKAIAIEARLEGDKIRVFYGAFERDAQTAVIGRLERVDGRTLFIPKYGFSVGAIYTVVIGTESAGSEQLRKFEVQIPESVPVPTTHIINVFPTADVIPMNQLKFYIRFSAPMRMGNAYEHVRIYRLPDHVLESEAFLSMPEELWNPERTRLTLFFDPGRIKRGVQPNLQLGLPLVEGRDYELVIDKDWLDMNGASLTEGFRKQFKVAGVDRESPNPKKWILDQPVPDTHKALSINFSESMDYGLLYSALKVLDTQGKEVKGEMIVSDHESIWQFIPEQVWKAGRYKVQVNSWLEDLAGNSLRRKFDVDLKDSGDQVKDIQTVIIPFEVIAQSDTNQKPKSQ